MSENDLVGAVEAGGSKIICLIANNYDDIRAQAELPTSTPEETIREILSFFQEQCEQHGPIKKLGLASFGPVDLDPLSKNWGYVTDTPKPHWSNTDFAQALAENLGVPVAFDTDVNGAALAEGLWGAAQGLSDYAYITVGTGIGGGIVSSGQIVHGALHPEIGHIAIPHDKTVDPFSGSCPFHGNCLEGLASGAAMQLRWGQGAHTLPDDHPAWELEADYLSILAVNLIFTLSLKRILFGGGLMKRGQLFNLIREKTKSRLGGYLARPPYTDTLENIIQPPGLGVQAGPLGALALALHRTGHQGPLSNDKKA